MGAGEERRWPFAFTYRDWVIQALNQDMPYDRFVTMQLAADQGYGESAIGCECVAMGMTHIGVTEAKRRAAAFVVDQA